MTNIMAMRTCRLHANCISWCLDYLFLVSDGALRLAFLFGFGVSFGFLFLFIPPPPPQCSMMQDLESASFIVRIIPIMHILQ